MTSVFPAGFPWTSDALAEIRLSRHALRQAVRRGIDLTTMVDVVQGPEQVIALSSLREVRQSRIRVGDRTLLLRVIVEASDEEIWVVTMYRTSRIGKYWQR